jgi:hypothetical protein
MFNVGRVLVVNDHPARVSSTLVTAKAWLLVRCSTSTVSQGLTLVHFSAQRKRFLWDRGCTYGLFRGV